jgi:hypothetical protein
MDFLNAIIHGAGGYGIVISTEPNPTRVWKLFYDTSSHLILKEWQIQQYLNRYTFPDIHIPIVYSYQNTTTSFQNRFHTCGIEMEFVPPPKGFTEQVHMLLGYKGDDIDEEWGVKTSEPVSSMNPTRGFFASPESLETIWQMEGSDMTIERLAYIMGKTLRRFLDIGVLPIDVEWVWSNGKPTLLDFGLCEYSETTNPNYFLQKKGLRGLADDFYIPHEGDRGYKEFMNGYCLTD